MKAGNTAREPRSSIAAGLLLTVAAREIHMVVTGGSGAERRDPTPPHHQPLGLVVTQMPSAVIVTRQRLLSGEGWPNQRAQALRSHLSLSLASRID